MILHPHLGIISGRDAAIAFIARVLAETRDQFEKRARYATIELNVADDFAIERGTLAQELLPRAGGPAEHDNGQYLWVYARGQDDTWRIARIAGAFDVPSEGDESC